jgi:hypothetical protein
VFEVDVVSGGGVLVVVPVVGVTGSHDSLRPTTGSATGSDNEDNGVPGGTSTVKFSFAPPATVTVTTQLWAIAADGRATSAATNVPPAAATPNSLLPLNTALASPALPISRTYRLGSTSIPEQRYDGLPTTDTRHRV